MPGVGLVWDLLAKDNASPAFLRVAGAADKAAAATGKASLGMQASIARMGQAGATLTKRVTLPVLALGAASVDQAVKFQKSMTLIQTAGGETARKAEAISKGILTVAKDTGTSLGALSDGIYTIAKAGSQKWSATGQLTVLKAAAQGAKAENVDLGVAVNALTSVMMSYHLGTSQAVATENELIIGAGKAKTSMQEYAGSLATVVPIASAAGIKFDQIAGAIATLTQHGTSAQEATQELAFTIRNLQAPNNVAISAMNQLGISAVDVSKNLGKRGLTGTLQFIEQHLPKSGLVYLTTMKQMEAGTADLNAMQAKMTPQLAKLSKGLLDGSVTAKDYRTAFKDMGAAGYAQGSQFLSLAARVKGFNDNVRAGTPAQKTMAAELKQIFGGATGLNTALQLGGENMAYFQAATKAVGKAALETGSDVLGWNKTQDTLAVKMDKAKASLQVLAVEIGTALIPAVSKIVDGISKAVHWFDNLSGTQKKILAWSVGVLAALGPILSIGSRLALVGRGIGTFVGGISTQLATLGGASEASAGRFSTAMRGITAAAAGAGVGYAFGSLTRNSSNTAKGLSTLASAATGAAIGFGVGGPVGAAVGGLAGGLSGLVTNFLGVGDAAKKASQKAAEALAEQKQAADDLLGSLQSVSGAYNAQYKQTIISKLGDKGALGVASKAGISLPSLVSDVTGDLSAKQVEKLNTQLDYANITGKITNKEYNTLKDTLVTLGVAASSTEDKFQLENRAASQGVLTHAQLGISLAKLKPALLGTATTQDSITAAAKRNTAVIAQNVQAINASAASQLKHGANVGVVTAKYESQINTLAANLHALHFTDAEINTIIGTYGRVPKSVLTNLEKKGVVPAVIQAIIDKYNRIPASKSTTINADTANASANIAFIREQLAELPTYKTITVTARTVGNLSSAYASQVPQKAAGGSVNDGWFTVGEQGWELGRKVGSRVEIYSNPVSKAMTGLDRVPGYAKGTAHKAPTGTELSDVVSAFGALLAAAHNVMSTASDLSSAASDMSKSAKAAGISSRALAAVNRYSAAATADARRRDSVLARLGTRPTATTAYDRLAAAQQSYSDARSTVAGAVGAFDITTAGASAYTDQPGVTGSRILDQIKAAAAKATKFASLLKTLGREGLNKTLLMQLASAGPQAYDQAAALAVATPAQLRGINTAYGQISSAGSTAGTYLASDLYGAGVKSAQGLVNGLLSQERALDKAVRLLGDRAVAALKKSLHIHSPSRVFHDLGAMTGEGYVQGIRSKLEHVERAGKDLGNAATPGSQTRQWMRAGQAAGRPVEMHFHNYDIDELIQRQRRELVRAAQGFY